MKYNLTKNIGIKIASLLFAAVMWVIVTNINDPVDSASFFDVPVRIDNTHLLDEDGRVYIVLENTDIISRVTVRAPRSVISRISSENIIAKADIRDISSLDTVAVTLSVDNASPAEISDIFASSNILKLEIENSGNKRLSIRPQLVGEIAEGFMSADVTVVPNLVAIDGPESLIESVSSAGVVFDITGMSNDITGASVDVVLFDAEGNIISSDRIRKSPGTVAINIPILETKLVPISYTVTGTPANDHRVNGDIEMNRAEVLVAGRGNAIREITEIVIPPGKVDLSDRIETLVEEFNLTDYLPPNIRLVDQSEYLFILRIGIEEEANRTVTLRESQLRITNVPEGYQAMLYDFDETPPINLVGLQRDLTLIQPAFLSGEIDVERWMSNRNIAQLNEGNYQLPVDINLGTNITVGTVTVTVTFAYLELE
ncbi:MAG: CdaR family protein [Lachnospiraceae bacterium]|nr:CdaR family protein [Lachnospiraceae bacterium]